jgi:zinc/manganese transport system substrate-binding protein
MASAPAAAAVSTASVVVENGLGYDGFMDRLLSTSSPKGRVVVSAAHALGVEGTNVNPHLFYAVRRVMRVAQAIEQAYVRVDPTHRSIYEANLSVFGEAMSPLLVQLDNLQSVYAGTRVAQTERLAGYLLEEAGLKVAGPEGFAAAVEAGHEPNASDLLMLEELLGHGTVRALVVPRGAQSSATRSVVARAREHGVPVVLMSELVVPETASYPLWMGAQIASLTTALGAAA